MGLSVIAAFNFGNESANAELVVSPEYTIKSEYFFGETLNVPSPSSVKIKTGGAETSAVDVTLLFPDGTAKGEGNYELNKVGKYELVYYNANGVSVSENFVVNKKFYEYGDGAEVSYVQDLVGVSGKKGISVNLKDGVSFTFNKPINLKDHLGEAFDICTVYPMFREDKDSYPTATTLSIKIVDCYDSAKFVEFYIWSCDPGQGNYYMGAGASTQVLTGLEQNFNRPYEMTEPYEGQLYKIHRPQRYQSKTAWGRYIASSDNPSMIKNNGVTLIWDLSNHQMKAKNGTTTALITDIDSSEIYGINAIDFDTFFTTGEVYLNFEAYNYSAGVFEFGIEKVFGLIEEELADGKVQDVTPPDITVDIEPTEKNSIYLSKGKSVKLPEIKRVLDYNFYDDVNVSVYRNYGKAGQAAMNTKNGEFTPDSVGEYAAVYTATDAYGNVGRSVLSMLVTDDDNIVYDENKLGRLVAAKVNVLPKIDARGINGEVSSDIVVTEPNGKKVKAELNSDGEYEYVPAYAGKYTVTYIFKDNVYEEEFSYDVTCVDENSAIFVNPFALPLKFINGASYTIDKVIAYTAGNGSLKENFATVSVSEDGGAYRALSENEMKAYKVTANSTLRFKASYGKNEVESDICSVTDVGYGKKTTEKNYLNYWQGNYDSASVSDDGFVFEYDKDAKLEFINMISSANFKASFNVGASYAEKVTITLKDARDPHNNYITSTYYVDDSFRFICATRQFENGVLSSEVYEYLKRKDLSGEYLVAFSKDVAKSFAEDRALFGIEVEGVSGDCNITFSQLNNQSFSSSMREGRPELAFKSLNGVKELNSTYQIEPSYATSVTSTVLSFNSKLTVLSPDGSVVYSTDGLRLFEVATNSNYTIKLDRIGQYRVTISATSIGATRSGGKEELTSEDYYIVNVSEGVPPTIKFSDGSTQDTVIKLKVGETHDVKEFTVTDNGTASENVKVYVMIVDDGFTIEANGFGVESYKFVNAGNFKVYVVAYDELGNSSETYYSVVVE